MIQIVKKKKPNSDRIKTLREVNNLSQEQFLRKMKEELGYTMSRRTYQRIEKGDDVQPKYLDYIIKFYDRKNIKLKIDELISENFKKKKRVGKATKSSFEKIIQDYDYQKTYLYNVNHFEEVSKLIAKSSRRKFFYPLTPNSTPIDAAGFVRQSEMETIEKTVSIIDEYGKKQLNNRDQINREKYDSAKLEIDLIRTVTEFGEYVQFLNSQGVRLYAGNFNLAQFGIEAVHPGPDNNYYKYGVYDKTISIFCFKRDDQLDLNFNYENYWHKEKLEQILKKNKMDNIQKDEFEWQDHEKSYNEIRAFEDTIKYFDGIDTSKVTFDHRVPFTNDDFDDPYEGFEPDGKDLSEMEADLLTEKNEREDEPF